ncbi:MAG: hypothetical protein FJW56_07965 [Actinobacteria bacterium]|nr:hypothetical protein [Actinomycetota bacterium]
MKSKSVGIILVIFFSFWSWLYTYGKKKVKFWIIFALNIIFAIVVLLTGYIFISITTEGHPEFAEYPRGFETMFYSSSANISETSYRTFGIIILTLAIVGVFKIGIWIWAIIDNTMKSEKTLNCILR